MSAEFAQLFTRFFAEGEAAQSEGPNFLFLLIAFMLIWIPLVILPGRKEKKRKAAMMAALKKGDKLLINPGIIAKLINDKGDTLIVESQGSKMEVMRSLVERKLDSSSES